MATTELAFTNYIEEFALAFKAGVDGICKAAEIYVKVLTESPERIDDFRNAFVDTIPMSAWKGFEAVGKKSLHPSLLLGGGGPNSARIKGLPYSDQERVFSGHKFVLLTSDDSRLKVDLRHVTRDQAKQIFAEDHIRSEPEQKLWLEREKTRASMPGGAVREVPYTISGGKVIFKSKAVITKEELKRILMEL